MPHPVCTEYAGYDIDVYLLILSFLIIFIVSFCCCCQKSDTESNKTTDSAQTLPTTQSADGSKAGSAPSGVGNLFCGDEFLCCRKGNSCEDQQKRKRNTALVASVIVRFIVAVVLGILVTWVLLSVIFVALKESLMYPAELASDCTPCTGNLSTITFADSSSVAADRSPYCCDYNPAGYLSIAQEGTVDTPEGDVVHWWWIPGTANASRRVTLLYNHGSGRNLASAYRLQRYHFLASIGVNVLAYDYPGYGESTCADSTLSDATAVRGAKAMVAMVTDGSTLPDANVTSSSQLLMLGRSMGTGVSLQLVSEGYDFRSVMLQSPFSTYSEAVGEIVATALSRWIVIGLSGGDTFDNVDNIDDLTAPLYESATVNDDFVPFSQSEEVYAAAVNVPSGDKKFVEYTCYSHDDDLSPTEKVALTSWVNRFA